MLPVFLFSGTRQEDPWEAILATGDENFVEASAAQTSRNFGV